MEKSHAYEICVKHIHRYVRVQMRDGCYYEGIIEKVDEKYLYLAVPIGGEPYPMPRAFTPYGYGFYPYYPIRFRRLILPLAALLVLSLIPYY
ncbi:MULTISPECIES: hypothetical protein [unclassified Paenibacillus]|uniref:hypothetical protein n=1 Tax=unclassified Paenibacillus TaxID=185978 RepID=UPI001C11C696|nr:MULTISPECIES: hypothetical protein [unclassified Paenibacillus]MBU5440452.1 hypothetical protein [Paenibacillus sp. MSJ-34]CAH0119625.1 hypothetical protein PAE9249_02130 [Paenibacillus sp. CECT 9249]